MPKLIVLLFSIAFATIHGQNALACGQKTDCKIGERTYRISMPEGHDGKTKIGAIIFNHGYRGTAAGLMRNRGLRKIISDLGVAFVAPKSARDDWDIPNSPQKGPGKEIEFFDRLKEELIAKHSVDGKKIIVSGFSAGGMMTWNLACDRGSRFAGFVPIAGTFWAPVPKQCAELPADIIHIHGTSDKIVPLKGRPIADTHQGDVYKALKLATKSDKFGKWNSMGDFDGLSCQQRVSDTGKMLQLCLHPGGHSFKGVWLKRAWNEFVRIGAIPK